MVADADMGVLHVSNNVYNNCGLMMIAEGKIRVLLQYLCYYYYRYVALLDENNDRTKRQSVIL